MKTRTFFIVLLLFFLPIIISALIIGSNFVNRASQLPASIIVNSNSVYAPLPMTWKAIAQGGEEQGVSMIAPVISQTKQVSPRYIRLDHIYDFYNVVNRDPSGKLYLQFDRLDQTVCDILKTGARPFLSLGYMPESLSSGGLTDPPKNWDEWSFVVQKTIEEYSGGKTVCGFPYDEQLSDVYYEVWNEPDHPSFGGWSIHGGAKDYRKLYYYSAKGAQNAVVSKRFFFGGPATTAPYQTWTQKLLDYVSYNNLRTDFISWHRYSQNPDVYLTDVALVDSWLWNRAYEKYRALPKVISEWGFDSEPNPLSDTDLAAAHTIHSIRNLIEQKLELAFMFELKDGPTPSWGILSYSGEQKPRYKALVMLNELSGKRIYVTGENEFIKALASKQYNTISIILSNYDRAGAHSEIVPVTINGLEKGTRYAVVEKKLNGVVLQYELVANSYGEAMRLFDMKPNTVISLSLTPNNN